MPGQLYLSAAAIQLLYFDASRLFLTPLAFVKGERLQFLLRE